MLRLVWTIGLALLLTGCATTGLQPNSSLVQQAIGLQLSQTQQELRQQLHLDQSADITVNRVTIAQQTPLQIENLPSYHVTGTCDFTVKLPKRDLTERNTPFEVYLQRQSEGKTWRLATLKPGEDGSTWVTQRIPTAQFE